MILLGAYRKWALIPAAMGIIFSSPLQAAQSPLVAITNKSQAVVSIEAIDAAVYQDKPQGLFDPATGQVLIVTPMRRVAATQTGGGIIIDARGVIVTNTHTVRNSGNVFVTLFNGTRVRAKIIHHVPGEDISFLSIEPPFPLKAISFADSDNLPIGMDVYTIGHSDVLSGSISGGEIKSFGRESFDGAPHVTLIQINFRSYKGDSGSPVMDSHGNLVGMISAGESRGDITLAIASSFIGSCYQLYLKSAH